MGISAPSEENADENDLLIGPSNASSPRRNQRAVRCAIVAAACAAIMGAAILLSGSTAVSEGDVPDTLLAQDGLIGGNLDAPLDDDDEAPVGTAAAAAVPAAERAAAAADAAAAAEAVAAARTSDRATHGPNATTPAADTLVVVGVGDIMMLGYPPKTAGAMTAVAKNGGRFRALVHYLSPLLLRADHVFATVEGTLGSDLQEGSGPRKFKATAHCTSAKCDKINSYTWGNFVLNSAGNQKHPLKHIGFHYPAWMARDLYEAGVTVGATADNHAYDRREKGIDSTLNALKAAGIVGVGTSSKAEAKEIKKAAFKSGAIRPPGAPGPDASPWYKITTAWARAAPRDALPPVETFRRAHFHTFRVGGAQTLTGPSTPQIRSQRLCIRG